MGLPDGVYRIVFKHPDEDVPRDVYRSLIEDLTLRPKRIFALKHGNYVPNPVLIYIFNPSY